MRKRLFFVLTLGVGMAAGFIGRDRLEARSGRAAKLNEVVITRPQSSASPIDVLNYRIQDRLQNQKGFGMARIPVVPQHIYEFPSFSASRPEDQAVVADLRQRGWTVGLFLGGRGLLDSPMSQSEWEKAGRYSNRRAISKPILVSGDPATVNLPKPWELWSIGQQGFAHSPIGDRYQAQFDCWTVDVRPVRANREECLQCHSNFAATNGVGKDGLKIGDALGVAIYVYARNPK